MAAGDWLDTLLALFAVTALVALYLLRSTQRVPAGGPDLRLRRAWAASGLGRRLGRYYPTVMRQAGFDPDAWRWAYWLAKLVAAAGLPLLLLELWPGRGGGPGAAWLALVALVGFLTPDASILWIRQTRRRQISKSLAYFLDLLVAFLHAGLNLEVAFRRAGRDGFASTHPLAREVALVSLELDAGREPDVAFQALADRTGVFDLHGVAAALRSGLRLGAPVVRTLQAQAELLWTKRRETALRQINSAVIKAVFPLMLCGFPIFFVLAFFPAIVELGELMRNLVALFR